MKCFAVGRRVVAELRSLQAPWLWRRATWMRRARAWAHAWHGWRMVFPNLPSGGRLVDGWPHGIRRIIWQLPGRGGPLEEHTGSSGQIWLWIRAIDPIRRLRIHLSQTCLSRRPEHHLWLLSVAWRIGVFKSAFGRWPLSLPLVLSFLPCSPVVWHFYTYNKVDNQATICGCMRISSFSLQKMSVAVNVRWKFGSHISNVTSI